MLVYDKLFEIKSQAFFGKISKKFFDKKRRHSAEKRKRLVCVSGKMEAHKIREEKDMNLAAHLAKGILYIVMDGEIDEHSAADARRIADKLIDENTQAEKAVFDLEKITFMDSTGIGFLIGRYKKLKRYGIPMYITNPNLPADKILSLSGVYTLIPKL